MVENNQSRQLIEDRMSSREDIDTPIGWVTCRLAKATLLEVSSANLIPSITGASPKYDNKATISYRGVKKTIAAVSDFPWAGYQPSRFPNRNCLVLLLRKNWSDEDLAAETLLAFRLDAGLHECVSFGAELNRIFSTTFVGRLLAGVAASLVCIFLFFCSLWVFGSFERWWQNALLLLFSVFTALTGAGLFHYSITVISLKFKHPEVSIVRLRKYIESRAKLIDWSTPFYREMHLTSAWFFASSFPRESRPRKRSPVDVGRKAVNTMKMGYVFLSHDGRDREQAIAIGDVIEKKCEGISEVYISSRPEHRILSTRTKKISEELMHTMRKADTFIFLVSQSSLSAHSSYIKEEVLYAFRLQKLRSAELPNYPLAHSVIPIFWDLFRHLILCQYH